MFVNKPFFEYLPQRRQKPFEYLWFLTQLATFAMAVAACVYLWPFLVAGLGAFVTAGGAVVISLGFVGLLLLRLPNFLDPVIRLAVLAQIPTETLFRLFAAYKDRLKRNKLSAAVNLVMSLALFAIGVYASVMLWPIMLTAFSAVMPTAAAGFTALMVAAALPVSFAMMFSAIKTRVLTAAKLIKAMVSTPRVFIKALWYLGLTVVPTTLLAVYAWPFLLASFSLAPVVPAVATLFAVLATLVVAGMGGVQFPGAKGEGRLRPKPRGAKTKVVVGPVEDTLSELKSSSAKAKTRSAQGQKTVDVDTDQDHADKATIDGGTYAFAGPVLPRDDQLDLTLHQPMQLASVQTAPGQSSGPGREAQPYNDFITPVVANELGMSNVAPGQSNDWHNPHGHQPVTSEHHTVTHAAHHHVASHGFF